MTQPDANQTFLAEARDLLEQLEEALLDLEKRPGDQTLINTTFRALHTLKGSGGMFGPPDMAAFAHHLEDAFETVRQGISPLTTNFVGILLQSTDHLRDLLFEPEGDHEQETAKLIAAMKAEVGASDGAEAPAGGAASAETGEAAAAADAEGAERLFRIDLRLPTNALAFGTNPLALLDELRELGEAVIHARIDEVPDLDTIDPAELFIHWQIDLTTRGGRDAIDDVFIFVDDEGAVVVTELELPEAAAGRADAVPHLAIVPPAAEAPAPSTSASEQKTPADEPKAGNAAKPAEPAAASRTEKPDSQVRVSASRLDTLLDQVGELVIAQARLTVLANHRHDPALSTIVEEIERLSADLRDSAMDMRMLPIDQLFGRYRRVVRDLSGDLGKEIDLVLAGEETELDKTVLDRLGDPLVHIIRNSIDHGIEAPQAREAAGKPRKGRLDLSARQSGTDIIITVTDDGAGLNRSRILEKAIAAGVITADAEITDHQIDDLIFHPGLSTAQTVSNLSGRGVGMDVVKRTINDLNGTIEIASEPGKGTRFTLRLPLTLAIIDGLQVAIGETMCILPLSSVEECVELDQVETRTSNGRNFVDIRGTMVPLLWMDRVFKVERRGTVVAIVETEAGKVGVVVDQVIGQHQTVIKPLSPIHRNTPGLVGATILGDGSVALILEIAALGKAANSPHPEPSRYGDARSAA